MRERQHSADATVKATYACRTSARTMRGHFHPAVILSPEHLQSLELGAEPLGIHPRERIEPSLFTMARTRFVDQSTRRESEGENRPAAAMRIRKSCAYPKNPTALPAPEERRCNRALISPEPAQELRNPSAPVRNEPGPKAPERPEYGEQSSQDLRRAF
jgi:hypothetical protein